MQAIRCIATTVRTSVPNGDNGLGAATYNECTELLRALTDAVGACERIKLTPMTFGYVAALRSFLMLWLVTLPLALVGEYGWLAAPILGTIALLFISIEQMAVEIEQPFGEDANDLPIESYLLSLERSLLEMIPGNTPILDQALAEVRSPTAKRGACGAPQGPAAAAAPVAAVMEVRSPMATRGACGAPQGTAAATAQIAAATALARQAHYAPTVPSPPMVPRPTVPKAARFAVNGPVPGPLHLVASAQAPAHIVPNGAMPVKWLAHGGGAIAAASAEADMSTQRRVTLPPQTGKQSPPPPLQPSPPLPLVGGEGHLHIDGVEAAEVAGGINPELLARARAHLVLETVTSSQAHSPQQPGGKPSDFAA